MLTDKSIEKLANDAKKQKTVKQKSDDDEKRGHGRLLIRAQPTGNVTFWYRYRQANKWVFLEIGPYDREGGAGLSLAEARRRLQELASKRAAAEGGDLKTHILTERRIEQIAEEQQREAARQAVDGTLRKLLQTYIDHLEKLGKTSTSDVRNLFTKNVFEAFPELCTKNAGEVTASEITDVLRKMIERGVERNTAKLRSYIRAAYSLAMQAANDPTVSSSAQIFNLQQNPAASIPALSQFNKVGDRVLDANELGHYILRVEKLNSLVTRSLLLIALYLGGQRPTQLARIKREHLNMVDEIVMLLDYKGKRSVPRQHFLPLPKRVITLLKPLLAIKSENGLVFSSNGEATIDIGTASNAATEICRAMVTAGEAHTAFTMRDIRRTCETMLAASGVSRDVRGQVQSHGLGGVQNRHYDRHLYMDEKRASLNAWCTRLTKIRKACEKRR